MNKKYFTIIEMMIALLISSAVFIIIMGMVMNVAWLVRDNYVAQSLINNSRYVRYVVLNGSGGNGGLSSAIGGVTKAGGKLSYLTSKSEDYDLAAASKNKAYTPSTHKVEIKIADNTVDFEGENLLPQTIKLLDGNKLTIDEKDNNVFVRSYLSRTIMGRKYEMGILTRTYNNK